MHGSAIICVLRLTCLTGMQFSRKFPEFWNYIDFNFFFFFGNWRGTYLQPCVYLSNFLFLQSDFFFLSKPMLLSICLFYLVVSCDFLFKFPNIFQRLSIYSIFYSKLLLFHVELFDITMQQSIYFVSITWIWL